MACGADGHGKKTFRLVLIKGEHQAVRCDFLLLVPLKVRLVSQIVGKPIARGTVSPAFFTFHELPFESNLLEKHLRLKHESVSQEEGRCISS